MRRRKEEGKEKGLRKKREKDGRVRRILWDKGENEYKVCENESSLRMRLI